MTDAHLPARSRIERRLAAPMFVLAYLFLLLLAGVVHLLRDLDPGGRETAEAQFLVGGLLLLWPVFLVESVLRYCLHDRPRRGLCTALRCLVPALVPPLRMGVRSAVEPEIMWLPGLGWRKTDFDLEKELELVFSGPMLLMASLILPLLVVEYGWADAVAARPGLRRTLSLGIGVIWLAFATEFIVRFSAAERKRAYAFRHWVDLAVVLLPVFEFLPFLRLVRLTRLMRFETLMSWIKYYRLYGVAGKGWRGLVVLKVVQQMLRRTPESRLMRLQARLECKEEERCEIDREIDYYRRRIEALQREGGGR